MRKNIIFRIRLTNDQWYYLRDQALKQGFPSVSEYIRFEVLLAKKVSEKIDAIYDKVCNDSV